MKEITKEIKDYLLSRGYTDKKENYYLDVWLWLWREKKIKIKPIDNFATYIQGFEDEIQLEGVEDPEDAIVAAVEHLCKNDLIK